MIIDTSVLMAILLEEPEAERLVTIALSAASRRISAGNWIELGALMSRHAELHRRLQLIATRLSLVITSVDEEQARIGYRAYAEFGRGNHPAKLNFGNCFAYALAKATGEPLLFNGEDFSKTDILSAA